jgi:hypothetical protein
VLGTQETFYIVIAGLLERDSFDLLLPEFDKPWVIHLRETCCCSTNLCTWRPNTVYKNRRVRRHHPTVIYLPSILVFILWRDTTSELWTPVQFLLHCYYRFTFTRFIYILANYYLLPLDTLNPLFRVNQ